MTRTSSLSSVLLSLMAVSLCLSNAWASGKSSQMCKKCRSECQTKECECKSGECQCRTAASKCKTQKCRLKNCESEKCKTKTAEAPGCSPKSTINKPQYSGVDLSAQGRFDSRAAWLWMKFPDDKNPRVSVNFTEYPPAGNFRIFRTTIPYGGKRRYYVSATYLKGEKRISLKPSKADRAVARDELTGQWYVDLSAGQTVKILFNGDQESSNEDTVNEATLRAELERVRADLAMRIRQSEQKLRDEIVRLGNKDSARLEKKDIARLESKIDKLNAQPKKAPSIHEDLPTMQFRFRETEMAATIILHGNGTVKNVDMTKHPSGLTIEATQLPVELGALPLKGELYLAVFNGDQQPAIQPLFILPKSESVQFRKPSKRYVADVPFGRLATPLSMGIKNLKPVPAKLLVRGYLRFTLKNGRKTVYGPLGNQIELTVTNR